MSKIVLTPEIIRKAHDGEDQNALNYRVAKARDANLDVVIQNPQGYAKEMREHLIIVLEVLLGIPPINHRSTG